MTRPLVHLRERVRSERCSWGVINMENGREDRLRLGEEDEPGRRSGGRKRRTSGRQTAIRRERTRQQKKRRVMMRLFLCLLIFLLGAGIRLDAARENDPQADRSVHDRDAKLG